MTSYGISMGVSPREPLSNVGDIARAADEGGLEALWMIDFQLGMKDVYAAMNVAALNSENLHIGPGVTNLLTRHPTVTANAMVALDELCDGKAMLGLGAGWSAVLAAGRQPSKLGDIEASLPVFRQLFSGEELELDGAQVNLATAQRQIPLYLAVSQPGMLRLCGAACDGAILMGAADVDFCRWQLDFINEGLDSAGRDRKDLTVDLVVTMSVDEDRDKALGDVRAWATSQAATFHPWKRMPAAYERFRPEFERAADAYHLVDHLSLRADHKTIVSDEFVNSVAIAGPLDECVERVRELAALDVDRITFALLSGGRRRRLQQLIDEVIPAVTG